jgi:hypothetical protein
MSRSTRGRNWALALPCALLMGCGSGVDERGNAEADTSSADRSSASEAPTASSSTPSPGTAAGPEADRPTGPGAGPGAGRPGPGGPGADPSTTSPTTPPTTPPSGPAPEPPPPQENTAAPLPPTENPPPGPRTVQVSGPTVDNRYPAEELTFYGAVEICNPYTNGFSAEPDRPRASVTIRSVEVVNQQPSGAPVFRIVSAGDLASCARSFEGTPLALVGQCEGATLPQFSGPGSPGCALGLEFIGATVAVATLRFHLEATCTGGTIGAPCDSPEVTGLGPTPAAPVVVRWSVDDDGLVRACPNNSPEFGGTGTCP